MGGAGAFPGRFPKRPYGTGNVDGAGTARRAPTGDGMSPCDPAEIKAPSLGEWLAVTHSWIPAKGGDWRSGGQEGA